MTKKEARRERQAKWNQAIREGRMVNFGEVIRPYATADAAKAAVKVANEDGLNAFIVPRELAQ